MGRKTTCQPTRAPASAPPPLPPPTPAYRRQPTQVAFDHAYAPGGEVLVERPSGGRGGGGGAAEEDDIDERIQKHVAAALEAIQERLYVLGALGKKERNAIRWQLGWLQLAIKWEPERSIPEGVPIPDGALVVVRALASVHAVAAEPTLEA